MNSNIKLNSEILRHKEYLCAARFKLFVTLLFLASREANFVDGESISRGELVTSLRSLSAQTSLTLKQVRLGLLSLQKAGVITLKTSPLHTVVTICNFDSYAI